MITKRQKVVKQLSQGQLSANQTNSKIFFQSIATIPDPREKNWSRFHKNFAYTKQKYLIQFQSCSKREQTN